MVHTTEACSEIRKQAFGVLREIHRTMKHARNFKAVAMNAKQDRVLTGEANATVWMNVGSLPPTSG